MRSGYVAHAESEKVCRERPKIDRVPARWGSCDDGDRRRSSFPRLCFRPLRHRRRSPARCAARRSSCTRGSAPAGSWRCSSTSRARRPTPSRTARVPSASRACASGSGLGLFKRRELSDDELLSIAQEMHAPGQTFVTEPQAVDSLVTPRGNGTVEGRCWFCGQSFASGTADAAMLLLEPLEDGEGAPIHGVCHRTCVELAKGAFGGPR